MDNDAKPKLVFAPGCFDEFDGTQEELDELVAEIKGIFEGKTLEEIQAMSKLAVLDELDAEELEMILNNIEEDKERKLH